MHTVPAGKRLAYDNMIGNINEIINPLRSATGDGITIPAFTLTLPLPFFFSRDTGISMPCSNMNYTPLKLWFDINELNNLVILDDVINHYSRPLNHNTDLTSGTYNLTNLEVWGEFAVVSGPERKSMGKYVRDMLIDQFQISSRQTVAQTQTTLQLTFSQSVRALFFAYKNVTNLSEGSNYSAGSPVPSLTGVNFNPISAVDPISNTTIRYDSVERITNFPSDFFSLVMPYYHAPVVPYLTGYHYYPYSIYLTSVDPMCSTNYTKLNNIFLNFTNSAQCNTSLLIVPSNYSAGTPTAANAEAGTPVAQQFHALCVAYNHIIIRVSGGTVSFPLA